MDEQTTHTYECAHCGDTITAAYAYDKEFLCFKCLRKQDFMYAGLIRESEKELARWKRKQLSP